MSDCYFSDIDECGISNGGCHADATCQNTEGSFTCTCKSGYGGDGFNCVGRLLCQNSDITVEIKLFYQEPE